MENPTKFGPNTPEVRQLIKKLKAITPEQTMELAAAYDAAWNDAWDAAWNAARSAANAVPSATRDAAYHAAYDAAWAAARSASYDAAWAAAYDAVLALLVKDLISEDNFHTLYGPWAAVMEVPIQPPKGRLLNNPDLYFLIMHHLLLGRNVVIQDSGIFLYDKSWQQIIASRSLNFQAIDTETLKKFITDQRGADDCKAVIDHFYDDRKDY